MKLALVQAWMGRKLSHWKTSAKGIRSCHSVKTHQILVDRIDWISERAWVLEIGWAASGKVWSCNDELPQRLAKDTRFLSMRIPTRLRMDSCDEWMGVFQNWDVYLEPKDPPLRHMSRRMATLIHSDMPLQGAMLALGPPATMARMLILFEQRHGWGAIGGRRRWKGHGKCANNGGLFLE